MQLFRFAILSLAAAALSFAADIDGKWTGELTGKITTQMGDPEIKERKIKGDDLSWFTTFDRDGNSIKTTNKAKITGAEMKVNITVEGGDFVMEYTAKKAS